MAAPAGRRDYDHLFKLVLLGDSGVGKSCLLLRSRGKRSRPKQQCQESNALKQSSLYRIHAKAPLTRPETL